MINTDDRHILMIEPRGRASAEPVIDELTRKMAGALAGARPSEVRYRGIHTCVCGAWSGNCDLYVATEGGDELTTNSLAVHYLAHHRNEVPADEIDKLFALTADPADPTPEQLASPGGR